MRGSLLGGTRPETLRYEHHWRIPFLHICPPFLFSEKIWGVRDRGELPANLQKGGVALGSAEKEEAMIMPRVWASYFWEFHSWAPVPYNSAFDYFSSPQKPTFKGPSGSSLCSVCQDNYLSWLPITFIHEIGINHFSGRLVIKTKGFTLVGGMPPMSLCCFNFWQLLYSLLYVKITLLGASFIFPTHFSKQRSPVHAPFSVTFLCLS